MSTIIDFRSDTVTKPTPEMLEAMMTAEVGDDVFGEDPTIKKLEQELADMFGMDAGLFCPSGTIPNQIAIRLHTQPQDEVICDKRSHIYLYEGGGIAANSLVTPCLLDGDRGRITAAQVLENIKPDDIHAPVSRLVSLENTMNKGGGCCYDFSEVEAIQKVCREHNLALHLDGARLFNALVKTGDEPKSYGNVFDTISICLSKGLGAPVGSVLLMSNALKPKALRIRKVFGGGMRQAGYLAAAGLYAIRNHVHRLSEDHEKAEHLEQTLKGLSWVESVMPVETNIVIFTPEKTLDQKVVMDALKNIGILAVPFGPRDIRLVTHLDISDDHMDLAEKGLRQLEF